MARLYYRYLSTLLGLSLSALSLDAARASSGGLHNTSFDGGLHWSTSILRLELEKDAFWTVSLRHVTTECKFSTEMVSRWILQGLENYLQFEDLSITWISMRGKAASFSRKEIEKSGHAKAENGYTLTKAGGDTCSIRDGADNVWFFERGLLTRIELASGLVVSCRCPDGIVEELSVGERKVFTTLWDGDSLHVLPQNAQGVLLTFDTSRQWIQSASFNHDSSRKIVFAYDRKLITSIHNDGERLDFTWKKVPFSPFPDRNFDYPFYLKSDGAHTYKHKYLLGNYILKSMNKLGGTEILMLNPRKETIKYYKY